MDDIIKQKEVQLMDTNALNELVEGILAILILRLFGLYYMEFLCKRN